MSEKNPKAKRNPKAKTLYFLDESFKKIKIFWYFACRVFMARDFPIPTTSHCCSWKNWNR
jgi:hypothetical protein